MHALAVSGPGFDNVYARAVITATHGAAKTHMDLRAMRQPDVQHRDF